jgi:hypothetical protein
VRLSTVACSGLNGSDITLQATNWFADGHAPMIIGHALSALSRKRVLETNKFIGGSSYHLLIAVTIIVI